MNRPRFSATNSRPPLLTLPKSGLRWDLPASLVVFLVAVPLSLGIAAASGAPVMAGLIAAAVGGIVAGSLGGSPLQVRGPAAGLTVIVAGLIEQFGWPATCAITAAAGVLQALLGLARVGRVALAIAPRRRARHAGRNRHHHRPAAAARDARCRGRRGGMAERHVASGQHRRP
ncbi:SulP family inorganic anion transporter [Arthrobacter sp. KBS0703]|uniref:SulP family inorganic anion transporter n=1 Tax=Arthrobacter sp. KBS0703 TaxID=1955698 RepID=UPI0021B1148D|nr:SulP family inorganic anion transporter [Arthrobacter sp. KBS0703]